MNKLIELLLDGSMYARCRIDEIEQDLKYVDEEEYEEQLLQSQNDAVDYAREVDEYLTAYRQLIATLP